jgi:beta-lactamase superfamily II metal-dependent hydrolase
MIEIEFIPVGTEVNTGDAIVGHFTDPSGQTRVIVVDGGFVDTSADIVSHIRSYYGTDYVDLMVCTHPDADHINGLTGVLEELQVGQLLIHRPKDYGYTGDDVASPAVEDLIRVAQREGTVVTTKAFAGSSFFNGALMIAGPTEAFYLEQLRAQHQGTSTSSSLLSFLKATASAIRSALKPRTSDPGEGTLTDNGGTTPRNNSSIVLDLRVDGHRALLTGDAGVPGLNAAADTLGVYGRANKVPDFFDVPHHGSRHNLDTPTLDRLIGPVVGDTKVHSAFVSVGAKADDFPRPEVANALKRRGYTVGVTKGKTIRWHRDAPARPTWVSITPLGWLEVE